MILNCNNISQKCCIFNQLNAASVSIRDVFKCYPD